MNVSKNKLRVADFFCGGGGFSEGFRQAGFDISFALDIWQPAIDTFKLNKIKAKVVKENIIKVSNLPDKEFNELVPDVEIIIGSPPCVAFSNSNKSGNADKTLGIELLKAYLRIIARKKYKENSILKFWALENVPNMKKFIEPEYSAKDLGLKGDWTFKTIYQSSGIYNAKNFGAPTNRKRFFCGEFPMIKETHSDKKAVPLQRVLDSLGDPSNQSNRVITDCNYLNLQIQSADLTDHFYEHIIPDFEWEKAKRAKQDKGYMGRMSFPENTQKPSRTVMATISSCSRESMILARNNGGYRLPTVREVASMMSFPIDYKFCGSTESVKYRLIGNAVPPKLSFAIAKAILKDFKKNVPNNYKKINHNPEIDFVNLNNSVIPQKQESPKNEIAKFKYHIPYLIYSAYRVELTNHHSDFENKIFRWDTEIHYSQGKKKANIFTPNININHLNINQKLEVDNFVKIISKKLTKYNDFQKRYCQTVCERGQTIGPFELLSQIRGFIDNILPNETLKSKLIEIEEKPFKLPSSIIIGYYILLKLMKSMEEK